MLLLLVFSLLCAFSLFLFNRLLVFRVDCSRFYLVIVVVFSLLLLLLTGVHFYSSLLLAIQFNSTTEITKRSNEMYRTIEFMCVCVCYYYFFLYLQRLRLNVLRLLRSKKFPRVYDSFLMHVFNSVFLLLLLPFRCVCVYMYHHVFQPLTNNTVFFLPFFYSTLHTIQTGTFFLDQWKSKQFFFLIFCGKYKKCYQPRL